VHIYTVRNSFEPALENRSRVFSFRNTVKTPLYAVTNQSQQRIWHVGQITGKYSSSQEF
jgi:hypothetical protein